MLAFRYRRLTGRISFVIHSTHGPGKFAVQVCYGTSKQAMMPFDCHLTAVTSVRLSRNGISTVGLSNLDSVTSYGDVDGAVIRRTGVVIVIIETSRSTGYRTTKSQDRRYRRYPNGEVVIREVEPMWRCGVNHQRHPSNSNGECGYVIYSYGTGRQMLILKSVEIW